MPNPQYFLQLKTQLRNSPVVTFNPKTSVVVAKRIGNSSIYLMDRNLKQQTLQASSDIHVTEPAYLSKCRSGFLNSSSSSDSPQISLRRLDRNLARELCAAPRVVTRNVCPVPRAWGMIEECSSNLSAAVRVIPNGSEPARSTSTVVSFLLRQQSAGAAVLRSSMVFVVVRDWCLSHFIVINDSVCAQKSRYSLTTGGYWKLVASTLSVSICTIMRTTDCGRRTTWGSLQTSIAPISK